ncbi:hypothetical protein HZ993_06135 [Rhodoferax sp. AJA081-3]|uniref:hypothetical protein n=1 Tax=Rhodoferax sp. AJA081-3 TaxID=2752316 RepID=UPI001ADF0D1B|nr:hypothetical protein [Rhodoferax sp. AJA081-3]QTN29401.1 hypothetical protein HZ993_06135 [Rhodoferax sp. AJA081-3]
MKLSQLFASLALVAAGAAFAGGDHTPQHGGIFVGGKAMDYELVAKPDVLQLYLRDHGKPLDASKAKAKLTLLVGSDKQEVELQPMADKLEAKGSFKVPAGTKVVAVVSLAGKSSTARFVLK